MHRILIINHYAGGPFYGMEYRTFYFAREWVRAGHEVLIIAANFSHLRQKNPAIHGVLTRETIEGVNYLWVRTPAYSGNGVLRVVNMAAFTLRLYCACRQPIREFNPDLIIASSTYTWDNWAAAYYAKKMQARYVYELHDIWPLSPMELGGLKPWHPFIWILQQAENFACRTADKIISLLPAAKQHLIEHGMLPDRFAYIPNGIVTEEWEEKQPVPLGHLEAISAFRKGKRCILGYVGGHGVSNALDTLVEAAIDSRLTDIGIVCVGNGSEKVRLQAKVHDAGGHILFLDPIPRRSVPALLVLFDGLYLGWKRCPLYRFGISPNKLYEYMMSGVPIIHAVDAANDPVQEAGCGLSVAPENAEELCAAILTLTGLTLDERGRMGVRGQQYVRQHHLVSDLAQRFLQQVWSSSCQ